MKSNGREVGREVRASDMDKRPRMHISVGFYVPKRHQPGCASPIAMVSDASSISGRGRKITPDEFEKNYGMTLAEAQRRREAMQMQLDTPESTPVLIAGPSVVPVDMPDPREEVVDAAPVIPITEDFLGCKPCVDVAQEVVKTERMSAWVAELVLSVRRLLDSGELKPAAARKIAKYAPSLQREKALGILSGRISTRDL